LGLVREDGGVYEVCAEVKVDALRGLLRVGTLLVPRFVFYAVLFTLLGTYLILALACSISRSFLLDGARM
jgi:hypothetical protein